MNRDQIKFLKNELEMKGNSHSGVLDRVESHPYLHKNDDSADRTRNNTPKPPKRAVRVGTHIVTRLEKPADLTFEPLYIEGRSQNSSPMMGSKGSSQAGQKLGVGENAQSKELVRALLNKGSTRESTQGLRKYESMTSLRGSSADFKSPSNDSKSRTKIKKLQMIYADTGKIENGIKGNLSCIGTPLCRSQNQSLSPDSRILQNLAPATTTSKMKTLDVGEAAQKTKQKNQNTIVLPSNGKSGAPFNSNKLFEISKYRLFQSGNNSQASTPAVNSLNNSQLNITWKQSIIDSTSRIPEKVDNQNEINLNRIMRAREFTRKDAYILNQHFETTIEYSFPKSSPFHQVGAQFQRIKSCYEHMIEKLMAKVESQKAIPEPDSEEKTSDLEFSKTISVFKIKRHSRGLSVDTKSEKDLSPLIPESLISQEDEKEKLLKKIKSLENNLSEVKSSHQELVRVITILKDRGVNIEKMVDENSEDSCVLSPLNPKSSKPNSSVFEASSLIAPEDPNNKNASRPVGISVLEAKSQKSNSDVKSTADSVGKNKFRLELEQFQQKGCDSGLPSIDGNEPQDFHDEFMARLPEFSLSWRQAALNERKYQALPISLNCDL